MGIKGKWGHPVPTRQTVLRNTAMAYYCSRPASLAHPMQTLEHSIIFQPVHDLQSEVHAHHNGSKPVSTRNPMRAPCHRDNAQVPVKEGSDTSNYIMHWLPKIVYLVIVIA